MQYLPKGFLSRRLKTSSSNPIIVLSLDEFEAVRLLDHEHLSQTQVAQQMRVHRSTVSKDHFFSPSDKIAQGVS